ncbi:MAG: hypothetical protein FJW64_01395 [Actinobacteria bacterium]|nr:hypothetical protein [Actinomycetota bacterium]
MTVPGVVIMAAGSLTILVGIVALYFTVRHVDDLRRQRASLAAIAVMYGGFLVGYLGVCVDSGQTPSVAVTIFVVVAGGALALWGKNIQRASEARRQSEEEQR